MTGTKQFPWSDAAWLNPLPRAEPEGDDLLVSTAYASDFWRRTSYGFIRDSGHALLAPLPVGHAVAVTFQADLTTLYDQAGVMVRVDERTWVKAGVEATDGTPHLGAVVTHDTSDWSLAPVPEWAGTSVTVRASRSGDALTIRARASEGPWRMVRLAHMRPDAIAKAGPFCCSPQREGLRVRFTRFVFGPADIGLHETP
ncbi:MULTISPECIES: DUF1349 domain-containing protein [Streptomyces]|uniref:Regulation of enolase 1 n=2 Tax=Streptomyces TaxID=1883 RepID=A0A124EC71_9ACTN|nr:MULTISPECIES: DUF1349 domain-containing protein [Streptomyces]KUH36708.1 hypothetical protein ATE80_22150 [Streptomyces kanasensis]UUS33879.1 DUF1349 domain-containing protein [Streptomyces changanensis]